MRDRLRRLVFGDPARPEFVPIGLPIGTDEVGVTLNRPGTDPAPTIRPLALSLYPLLIGLPLPVSPAPEPSSGRLTLAYRHCRHPDPLGTMELETTEWIPLPGVTLGVCRPVRSTNRCRSPMRTWAYQRYALVRQAKGRSLHNRPMTASDLRGLMVHYIQPRPVFFVSVRSGETFTMFPMDLVAPTPDGQGMLLSLRQTSTAHALLRASRRFALSDLPEHAAPDAYAIGRHHHTPGLAVGDLPFPCHRSPTLDLPVPAYALRIRELEITDHRTVGSHETYVAQVTHETRPDPDRPALHHIHALYAQWRRAHLRDGS